MPDWIHIPEWLYWPPGIYALIVALVAGIVPTHVKFYEHKWVKITYAVVLSLLVGLEIAAISHDRAEQDKLASQRFSKTMEQFTNQMAYLTDFRKTIQAQWEDVDQKLQKAKSQIAPNSLKVETLELTKDILAFVADREGVRPMPSTSKDYPTLFDQWGNQTMSQYIVRFDQRLIALQEKYKAKGLDAESVGLMCMKPVNPLAIPICAREIQALTAKLP
ncbi:MAG TPA: hypothetical protein VEI73_16455 [Candidatus Acidoferrum sp.]|nr:hypothetical protein [Candidatus Acidoferrum sp.]